MLKSGEILATKIIHEAIIFLYEALTFLKGIFLKHENTKNEKKVG